MAQQLLFGGGPEGNYLNVQPLLDAQPVHETQHQPPNDEDLFQCGKCKRQFNVLSVFVNHKQQQCRGHMNHPTGSSHQPPQHQHMQQVYAPQHMANVQPMGNITTSVGGYNQLPANVVLPEDMMTLTLDSNSAGTLHVQQDGGVHGNPFLSSVQMNMNGAHINSKQSMMLSNNNNMALPPVSEGRQLQLHPVAVVATQPAEPVMSTNQMEQGNMMSEGGEEPAGNAITVLIDESMQAMPARNSYTNSEQVSLVPPATPVVQWPVNSVSDDTQAKAVKKKVKKTIPRKSLSCNWCKKTFVKNFDLEQHKRAHTGEKPFQCVVCGRAFSQKSNVKKHMQTHKVWPLGSHNALPEQPAPQLMVVQERNLKASNRSKQTETVGTEPAASSNTQEKEDNSCAADDDIASMKWHFLVDSSYVCPYCPNAQTRFDTYYQLKSHLVTHKIHQVYKCVLRNCDKTFGELDEFLEHTKEHESRAEMTYHCHVCNKQFPTLDELGTHQYTHSIDPDTGLTDNRRKKSEWKWRCIQCGNTYTSPEALEHHMSTTSHNHPCPHCSKVYTNARLLRRHLAVHKPSSEREFKCDVCNKVMRSEYYLKAHKRIHTGELPYSCEICGKRFNRKDKVIRHALIHDPIKKFVCPFKAISGCEKAFSRPDKLKEHIHQHKKINVDTVTKISKNGVSTTGSVTLVTKQKGPVDPLLCKHCCNCRFESHAELVAHEALCAQIPKLKCKKCEITFNTDDSFAVHDCKPATETVFISQVDTVKVCHTRRRASKRKTVNRIELSPPPVKRNNRFRRKRHASDEAVKNESNSVVTVTERVDNGGVNSNETLADKSMEMEEAPAEVESDVIDSK